MNGNFMTLNHMRSARSHACAQSVHYEGGPQTSQGDPKHCFMTSERTLCGMLIHDRKWFLLLLQSLSMFLWFPGIALL